METLTPLKVKLLYTLKKLHLYGFYRLSLGLMFFFYPAFSRHQDISF